MSAPLVMSSTAEICRGEMAVVAPEWALREDSTCRSPDGDVRPPGHQRPDAWDLAVSAVATDPPIVRDVSARARPGSGRKRHGLSGWLLADQGPGRSAPSSRRMTTAVAVQE